MAWELLTGVFGMPKERLYVTYFEGNEALGLPADLEARELWIAKGLDASRVLPFGMKENFWEMGESGPCGPCSEIHFDRIGGRDAAALVNMDDPDVLEIWNLVFMQYNRESDGSLRPLPNKHVDTGAGLERVVSVLQNRRSNYDTDVFGPLFEAIQAGTGVRAYTGKVGHKEDTDGIDMAYRVVADHIRTLTVAISDGGLPSNEGRGYVLRRILRRAIRYAHEKLGAAPGFFASLVDVVTATMGAAFPELARDPQAVKDILLEEETQFRKTLDRGLVQFSKYLSKSSDATISGADAWRLYDTFGFPVDLTRLMAEERGFRVDEPAFLAAQEQAREVSKGCKAGDATERVAIDVHMMAELEAAAVPKTDDSFKYTSPTLDARVLAILGTEGRRLESAPAGALAGLVLDRTNFYAEQGGQLYDTGSIHLDAGEFVVSDVQVYGGYTLHTGTLKYGSLAVGDSVNCAYDELRRRPMRQNHTATHLLNFALRQVIPEADQRGSLVAPDRLRFDYAIKGPAPSVEQLAQIEAIVSGVVAKAEPVHNAPVPLDQAMRIHGLRAVFGETYPDPVRVVSVGAASMDSLLDSPAQATWSMQSIELCGGTHVAKSSDIRAFLILSDANIAKGIRRIVAVTGDAATKARALEADLEAQLAALELSKDDQATRAFGRFLEEAPIGLQAKHQLKTRLEALRKLILDASKAAAALQLKQVQRHSLGCLVY
jgi:alanyl-tRNA synthetase